MECIYCGKGIETGPLYRLNPKGEEGIWAHYDCMAPGEKTKVLPETKELVDIIDKG